MCIILFHPGPNLSGGIRRRRCRCHWHRRQEFHWIRSAAAAAAAAAAGPFQRDPWQDWLAAAAAAAAAAKSFTELDLRPRHTMEP